MSYDAFLKCPIRVGHITGAEALPRTRHLTHLKVDLGNHGQINVYAPIANLYDAPDLVGKQVMVLLLREPRKLQGHESQGIILAADVGGVERLLFLEGDCPAGTRVR
jgi:methionine--tRNA ligase beta chain